MKHNRLIISSIVTAALLTMGTTAVHAEPTAGCDKHARHTSFRPGHKQGEHRLQHMMDYLKMDQTQRDQVKELLEQNRDKVQEKRQAMHKIRQQLRDAGTSDTYDADRVKQLAEQKARLGAEMAELHTATFNRIYRLMMPEQKEKLKAMREQKTHRFE